MKRFFKYLLLVLTLFVFVNITYVRADEYTMTGSTGYKQVEQLEHNDLKYGVEHFIDKGESLKSGLKYQQLLNILRVPANSQAKIISYSNLNNHRWTMTTVTDLAKRFEAENPGWKVLAGVNGDFYDINGNKNLPYQTNNPLVSNGEYFKSSGTSAVGFKNDGSVDSLVGGRPTISKDMVLAVYDEFDNIIKELPVESKNTSPASGESAVYFGTYNDSKKYVPIAANGSGAKYVVDEAILALPNTETDFYGKGVITSHRDEDLAVGQFAIITSNPDVIASLAIGTKIRVQHEFTGIFAGVEAVTGHNANFLVDAEYSPHTNANNNTYARHPRTVVGITATGEIILSVIDGRNEGSGRAGMYGDEMAAYMKSLGAVTAYNLDGGGSSYMIIRENGEFVVKSNPSDGAQRRVGNAVLVAVKVPDIDISIASDLNKLTFNLDIINDNGFMLDEMFVKIGGTIKKVENGTVTFTDLNKNSSYYYELLHKNPKGERDSLMIDGNVKTLKEDPILSYFEVREDKLAITIKLIYTDPDKASNLPTSKLELGGNTYIFANGEIFILKSSFKGSLSEAVLLFTYNDNQESYEIELENIPYKIKDSLISEALFDLFNEYLNSFNNIYN